VWLLGGSLAVAAVAMGLRLAGPAGSRAAESAFTAIVAAVLLAIVIGIRAYRPAQPVAWCLIAGAYALGLVGWLQQSPWPDTSFPSVAAACFLASSALFSIALLAMARSLIMRRDGGTALMDSVTVMIALLLLTFHFLIYPLLVSPFLDPEAAPLTTRGPAAVYLICDVLALAVTAVLLVGGRLRPTSSVAVLLITVAVAVALLDDAVSTVSTLLHGPPVGVGMLLGTAAIGAAALHPSMRELTAPASVRARLGLVPVGLLVAAVAATPLLLSPFALPTSVPAIGLVLVALAVFAQIAAQTASRAGQARRYRRLLAETVRAKEHERLQVAADLHDGTIQRLAATALTAEVARRRLAHGDQDAGGRLLAEVVGDLEREVAELRSVAVRLRPPVLEELGLAMALRDDIRDFERRTGIRCRLDISPDVGVDPGHELILYRVVQELLVNVAKHARARNAWIRLAVEDGTAHLSIGDDGDGFDPATLRDLIDRRQFGLAGARDRVDMVSGSLRIDSRPGEGTAILVSLPPADLDGHRPSSDQPDCRPG
jgi:signal transduction histidine kinase